MPTLTPVAHGSTVWQGWEITHEEWTEDGERRTSVSVGRGEYGCSLTHAQCEGHLYRSLDGDELHLSQAKLNELEIIEEAYVEADLY
jgi:hypothetical protein